LSDKGKILVGAITKTINHDCGVVFAKSNQANNCGL